MRLRDLSIRARLALIAMGASGGALLLAAAGFLVVDDRTFRRGLMADLLVHAEMIGRNSTAALAFSDVEAARETLAALSAEPAIVGAVLYQSDGRVLATYRRDPGLPAPTPAPAPGPEGVRIEGRRLVALHGVRLGADRVGTLVLQSDLAALFARRRSQLALVSALLVVAGLAAYGLSALLRPIVTRPIDDLLDTAAAAAGGDYSVRAPACGRGELGRLVDGFNRMLGEIQARDEALVRHRAGLERTVEKRTEELLRLNEDLRSARDRAEEASRTKSEFLANMSHEIRTPLNGMLGMTHLALGTRLDDEQREYLSLIEQSGNVLLTVINDILDFSKMEAGKLQLAPHPFRLRERLFACLRPLAIAAADKDVELHVRVAPATPDAVVGDDVRLQQVLLNLVGNAVKFTERGEVAVEVEAEAEAGRDGSIRLRFAVRDSGIGIAPDKLRAIFEPFTQADGSTTRRFGGTGLGLTISSRLVELMGGAMRVRSEPGRGSSFSFAVSLGVEAAPGVPVAARSLAGARALVVDDSATGRRILREMLESEGAEVVTAQGGAEALAALDAADSTGRSFDVGLVDSRMPEMDGLELAAHLARRGGAPPLVLLLGPREQPLAPRRRAELRIGGIVTRPAQGAAVLEAVRRAIEHGAGAAGAGTAAPEGSGAQLRAGRPLRVLVAEDSPVNQRVALRLLERWGHDVEIVENGERAVEAFRRHPFDAILMDVQMPKQSGLEATAAIRAIEAERGGHVLILALTAHALEGDRERCLAAGMDGYLAKPLQPDVLFEALERAGASGAPAALDARGVLDQLGGDPALLAEVAGTFAATSQAMLDELLRAVSAENRDAAQLAAHRLRGAALNFGPSALAGALGEVERLARAGAWKQIRLLSAWLEDERLKLAESVQRIAQEVAP